MTFSKARVRILWESLPALLGLSLAQIFMPMFLDVVLSICIAGLGFWAGSRFSSEP